MSDPTLTDNPILVVNTRIACALEGLLDLEERKWKDELTSRSAAPRRGRPRKPVENPAPQGTIAPPHMVDPTDQNRLLPQPQPQPPTVAPVPVPAPAPAPTPVPVAEVNGPAPAPVPAAAPAPAPTAPVEPPVPAAAPTGAVTHDALRHAARPIVMRGDIPTLQAWLDRNFGVPSIGGIPEDRLAEAMIKLHDIL